MHRADQVPVLVQQVAERAVTERNLIRLAPPAPEPRVEAGLGERLLKHRQVEAGRRPNSRVRDAPATR